jgi:hypothetical protein
MPDDLHHYRDGNVVLYKRDRSTRWQARLKLPNHKWKRISTGQNDLRDASEIVCEKYDEMRFRLKSNLPLETKKFSSVARLAIDQMKKELESGYGKKTYLHYIGVIDRYLIPFFGDKHIDLIDYKLLSEFDEWRSRKIQRQPKASTITTHNSALNRIFKVALENGWMLEFQIPHLVNRGAKSERRPYFTKEEYNKLWKFMRKWS